MKRWWYNWSHPNGIHAWRWRFLRWWIILFSALTIYGLYEARVAAHNNRNRISDIQASRITSCITTYESIRQVFKPFFPPPGHRTAKQMLDLEKFNKIIDDKTKKCKVQVRTP